MEIKDREIPINSIIVVIGANGFIGLETCEKLLQARCKIDNLFDEKWPGKFELGAVVDFEEDGAFDEAFKGAAGVVYVSMPIIFDPEPAKVVATTKLAAAKTGVQHYVLSCSSKSVETTRSDNRARHLTAGMYNWDSLLKTSCGPRNDTFEWPLNVYSASKTLQSRASGLRLKKTTLPSSPIVHRTRSD
ncbi:hypothetical protein DPV78_003901 [Talaromyces pinophilus]|nr:hypothetical protein DPV78_003901 [Talaromyces pinophilus]